MLGGCSLGSIFANLRGGTYEQKCRSGERLLSAVAPQSERLADKCRWDVRAWGTCMPAELQAMTEDNQGSFWILRTYVSSLGNR